MWLVLSGLLEEELTCEIFSPVQQPVEILVPSPHQPQVCLHHP